MEIKILSKQEQDAFKDRRDFVVKSLNAIEGLTALIQMELSMFFQVAKDV